ncbi:hypothetical protein YB2330_004025, partial [Saitoella coloradoensis]
MSKEQTVINGSDRREAVESAVAVGESTVAVGVGAPNTLLEGSSDAIAEVFQQLDLDDMVEASARISAQTTIYEFSSARLRFDKNQHHQVHVDHREQVLIALFNRSLLLNRQAGGVYASRLSRDEDQNLFLQLGTIFFAQLAQLQPQPNTEAPGEIRKLFEEMAEFAERNVVLRA